MAWWPSDGNATDIADGHDGTLQNGATFTAGKVGLAFSFKGGNDFVSIPDSTDWDFGANDFTVDLWVRLNQVKDSMFIHQQSGSTAGGFEFDFQLATHLLVFSPNSVSVGIERSWSPQVDIWYHLAVTKTSGVYKLYVDGSQLGTEQVNPNPVVNVTGIVRIGNWVVGGGFGVNGLVDEVEIFNRALSADEIQELYNAASARKCKVDHFLSYKLKATKGATEVFTPPAPVTLTEQSSASALFDVKKPLLLHTPANKNDEGVLDENMHLEAYSLILTKTKPPQPKPLGRKNVHLENQFGDIFVDVGKPDRLLVPTAKNLTEPADLPGPNTVDHYRCDAVKTIKGGNRGRCKVIHVRGVL